MPAGALMISGEPATDLSLLQRRLLEPNVRETVDELFVLICLTAFLDVASREFTGGAPQIRRWEVPAGADLLTAELSISKEKPS